ncbi:MAG TPA: hypothetical protein VGI32_18250 [Steroidobacteraceae bacterium]
MSAFALSLHQRPERTAARLLRPTVLALVLALHAALLLIASRWQARLDLRTEEPLVFLALPAHMQTAEETAPPPSVPRKKPEPAHDTQLIVVPTPTAPPPAEQAPAVIDWNAEAALSAKHQAQSAAAPPPRALDKRLAGMYIDGSGLDQGGTPEFGWDHARTRRVEGMEGGGSLLWLNDRCFVVLYGVIPFPMCGVGKIPVRGDLFDHLLDAQAQEPHANNTAP